MYGSRPRIERSTLTTPGNAAIGALARHRLSGKEIDLARVQEALSESGEWWSVLFNVAGIGIIFGSLEGDVLVTTPSLENLFGYTEDEVKAIGPAGLTHPDDLATDMEFYAELMEGKRDFYQLDKRYIKKDGTQMWGRLTVVLLRDESDEPRFVTAMVEDITAQHETGEYEAKLREAEFFRKQALFLNDDVLQELVVAKLAFDSGDSERGRETLSESLAHLKKVIDRMLAQGEDLSAGDFVRGHLMGRMDD